MIKLPKKVKDAKKKWEKAQQLANTLRRSYLETLEKWQAKCEHTKKLRHPDPSGNNDVSWTCLVCGKEL